MASVHKHIRSGTVNKRPTTAIAEGQIALATNITSPGLFFKDSTGATIVKIGPVHVGATAPNVSPAGSAGNSIGEVWLDTSLTPIGVKIYNGSAFVNATPIGSTTVQGLLELATDAETQAGADTARAVTSASLQSKLSDSTSTTSNTTIASSTAVKAAYDLANAALPKTGGTVTGNLEIGTAGSLTFEGATADGFETTIAITDPTVDRTITLPNTTGTVITTGDTGTVTSTMILDGTIVDADINANAEISVSKLVDGSARQLLQTDAAGTGVEWASNIDIPGTLDVTSAATFDSTVTIAGDLTVNGTTTNINTVNLTVEDKNVIIGDVATPTDITADGGGITLKGTTDKTINWVDATDAWTLSEHVNIASAKEYRIAGTKVLDATSLGSAVVSSSLTSVGTIGTGVWQGTAIIDTYLATIATAGKVSNSATTAASANTASAIVARDGSGNFTAGTITAALTGAASSNVLKAGDTMTGALVVPLASAATPSLTFTGDLDTGVFSPGANQLAVATNGVGRLFVDASGHVSIIGNVIKIYDSGTSNANLIIRNSQTGDALGFNLQQDGVNALFYNSSNGYMVFATNATERLRLTSTGALNFVGAGTAGSTQAVSFSGSAPINSVVLDSSGRLGIGTSSPTQLLDIRSATSGGAPATSGTTQNGLLRISQTSFGGALDIGVNADNYSWIQATNRSDLSFEYSLLLNPNGGNVGIGTTSPGSRLEIGGDASYDARVTFNRVPVQASNDGVIGELFFQNNADSVALIAVKRQSAADDAYIQFATQQTTGGLSEKCRITSDGKLLVGTTSTSATCNTLLQATGGTGGTLILSRNAATPADGEDLGFISFNDSSHIYNNAVIRAQRDGGTWTATTSKPSRLVFSTTADGGSSPTTRVTILSSGAMLVPYIYATTSASAANVIVGTDGNLFRSTSSAKYKANVETLQNNYADAILNCRPVWYRSISKIDNPDHGFWGFIAEEVAEIDPRLVFWKTTESVVQEDGSRVDVSLETPEAEGVQYDRFVPHLLNLIKRQGEAISELQAEVAALKAA